MVLRCFKAICIVNKHVSNKEFVPQAGAGNYMKRRASKIQYKGQGNFLMTTFVFSLFTVLTCFHEIFTMRFSLLLVLKQNNTTLVLLAVTPPLVVLAFKAPAPSPARPAPPSAGRRGAPPAWIISRRAAAMPS